MTANMRALFILAAMIVIHESSQEFSWGGAMDRAIAFAVAYACVTCAMKDGGPNE
jgi:hypothetical protein